MAFLRPLLILFAAVAIEKLIAYGELGEQRLVTVNIKWNIQTFFGLRL